MILIFSPPMDSALADPILPKLLQPAIRYLLGETPAGVQFMRNMGYADGSYVSIRRLGLALDGVPQYNNLRRELERHIDTLTEDLAGLRRELPRLQTDGLMPEELSAIRARTEYTIAHEMRSSGTEWWLKHDPSAREVIEREVESAVRREVELLQQKTKLPFTELSENQIETLRSHVREQIERQLALTAIVNTRFTPFPGMYHVPAEPFLNAIVEARVQERIAKLKKSRKNLHENDLVEAEVALIHERSWFLVETNGPRTFMRTTEFGTRGVTPSEAAKETALRAELAFSAEETSNLPKILPRKVLPAEANSKYASARETRGLFDQIRQCLKTQGISPENKNFAVALFDRLTISTAMTLAGTWHTYGWENIRMKDFSTDLTMAILATTTKQLMMKGNHLTWRARYWRTTAFDTGRAQVEVAVYLLNPIDNRVDEGITGAEAERIRNGDVTARYLYNNAWNIGMSWMPPTIYELVNGTLCMYRNGASLGWVNLGMKSFQYAVALGTNILYFELREKVVY